MSKRIECNLCGWVAGRKSLDDFGCPSSVLEGGSFSSAPLDSASLQIHCIDPRQSCFVFRVKRETAPRPVLRVPHEPSRHRIRVHVLQFFFFLLVTVHVEIVKPRLPELWHLRDKLGKPK